METEYEKNTTDPVCGMSVDTFSASAKTQYKGKEYFFCGNKCAQKFQSDPEKYLAPKPVVKHSVLDSEIIYTCPMHPNVRHKGPSTCPKCGMGLEPEQLSAEEIPNPELVSMSRRFWVGLVLSFPIFFIAMGHHIFPKAIESIASMHVLHWFEFVLATPVVFICGRPFFVRFWQSIINRSPNMFTLIAIGVSASYFYSVVAIIAPQIFPASFRNSVGGVDVYFEPAAVITVLVLMGQVLELRARGKTSTAIRELLSLTPKIAGKILEDGSEKDIPIEDVIVGDKLRIRPGGIVPVDGVVIEGSGFVDESMITGEPAPVEKNPQSKIIGGTINTSGSLLMHAQRIGAETMLAQIVQMVAQAQRSKSPIQKIADTVAAYFVPLVFTASIITFIMWSLIGPQPRFAYALVNAVAVLIIACPCALGLATPLSITVGLGRGAKAGVLIKNAEALENMESVDTLVVDKTGTLTEGRPKVVSVVANEIKESLLIQIAAGVEQYSEHPLGRAIVNFAESKYISLENIQSFQSFAGKGVTALLNGGKIIVGSQKLLEENGIDVSRMTNSIDQSNTTVLVAVEGKIKGAIAIADPIKESARDAVKLLKKQAIELIMLTGDNQKTAEMIAKELGIEKVYAQVLPQDKNEIIKRLQQQGKIVAMAGDGINDAPALAQADVGIAMATGTDIAMESADIVLVKGDLRGIIRARNLSRATMRNIRQNIFFAFFYNSVAIPIAAGLLYPFLGILLSPVIAALAMSFSSVSVATNALRLRNTKL
ncbi:MAG: heavy metal translocating P-type ATPase [Planctomycetaceae bacterium]|nr:heavy metal translocating P-type ATPase [Planctomycetaceae bacterium]